MTIWILGLCVILLFLGGISLDLWRAFSDRRALAGIVDAAAIAGASDLDQDSVHARSPAGHPVVRLDEDAARRRAEDSLAINATKLRIKNVFVTFSPDLTEITVTASAISNLTLVRILLPGAAPLTLTVASTVRAQESG
ncbi:MAG: pilus assembly protein TadG-related protein [Actinomycetota bacterium]